MYSRYMRIPAYRVYPTVGTYVYLHISHPPPPLRFTAEVSVLLEYIFFCTAAVSCS